MAILVNPGVSFKEVDSVAFYSNPPPWEPWYAEIEITTVTGKKYFKEWVYRRSSQHYKNLVFVEAKHVPYEYADLLDIIETT